MRVLVSGASIAGPVLAFWLARHGIEVTVVERAPALRRTGGHAIDLFRPAMDVSDRMGVRERIEARATGTTQFDIRRPWSSRPAHVDYRKLVGVMSDRHVEIMRDDLSEIYYDATRDDVEYVFDDQITSISADGEVTFFRCAPRSFDVVVGADGLHSGVRRLTFGADVPQRFLGIYLAVVSVPKTMARPGVMEGVAEPDRVSMLYTADHLPDARALFMFRPRAALDYHHRDVDGQRAQLRAAFAGSDATVDSWLAELDDTPAFYFDAVTQLEMTRWSRGRVTLVGDAGYCPGPAVGGSTSLAVYGAYVLATEIARAKGDHVAAFAAYERFMAPTVRASRTLARMNAKTILPGSRWGTDALVALTRLISVLPGGVTSTLARLNSRGVRLYDTMPLPDAPRVTA